MARIGLLGGTFDPIHNAHLVAAVETRHAVSLDTVLMVVANVPWQKQGIREVTDAETRFEMVAAAVADVDGVEASRLEIDRGGESYTVDTVEQLAGDDVFVIVGADVARQLDTWHRYEDLRRQAGLVVVNRPGSDGWFGFLGWAGGTEIVDIPALEISGTDIRARVAAGRPIDGLVPPGAVRLIRERGLYAGPG